MKKSIEKSLLEVTNSFNLLNSKQVREEIYHSIQLILKSLKKGNKIIFVEMVALQPTVNICQQNLLENI